MDNVLEAVTEPFAPGNLVRLREPYRPGEPGAAWRGRPEEWRRWRGFTHGIVVEVLTRGLDRRATRVSLHLYDPERQLLYVHEGYTVPVYVDFHVRELVAHRIVGDEGYRTLPDLETEKS